jgi:hypothetical protein
MAEQQSAQEILILVITGATEAQLQNNGKYVGDIL